MIGKDEILLMKINSYSHSPVGNTIRFVIRMLLSFEASLPSGLHFLLCLPGKGISLALQ